MSSKIAASVVPDAVAAEMDQPWLLTASIGSVDLRRINSVSKPTRNSTPAVTLAFLGKEEDQPKFEERGSDNIGSEHIQNLINHSNCPI